MLHFMDSNVVGDGVTKQQIALSRALPILIATLVFTTIIALLSLRVVGQLGDTDQLSGGEGVNFSLLAPVCNAEGVANVSSYDVDEPGVKPIVVLRLTNGVWVADSSVIPSGWQATLVEETELVLCMVDVQEIVLPRCDDGADVLVGYRSEVGLVVAGSGRVLAQDTFSPDTAQLTCWDADTPTLANAINTDQIQTWLQPHILIP